MIQCTWSENFGPRGPDSLRRHLFDIGSSVGDIVIFRFTSTDLFVLVLEEFQCRLSFVTRTLPGQDH